MRTAVASALAMTLVLAGPVGCSTTPRHRTGSVPLAEKPGSGTPTPLPPLTPRSAAEAFRTFVTNDDVARAGGDERLALWWTSEGQAQLTAAAFRRAIARGEPVPRFRYGTPAIYAPRLRPSDPQWFVVIVRRSDADGKNAHTVALGFVEGRTQSRWRLSLATILDKKQKPPKIAIDADGYAKPLATFDTALLMPPRVVPQIQATLAEEGPGNVAAKVMATGRHTTDYYTADQKTTKSTKGVGLHVDTVYQTTQFPIFPLATTDGGGIVLYALSRNVATTKIKKKSGHVPVPADAAPLMSDDVVRSELDVYQTLQFVAVVPPKAEGGSSSAKAVVVGADGGTISASVPDR